MGEAVCLGMEDAIRVCRHLAGEQTECVCVCPGVFVYHLLGDDLSHSPPPFSRASYRSARVSTM